MKTENTINKDDNKNEKIRETEIKLRIDSKQAESLPSVLINLGFTYKSTLQETDTYFDGPDYITKKVCLRIHQKDFLTELTYKGPSTTTNTQAGVCSKVELNADIINAQGVEQILVELGHPKLVVVDKQRISYTKNNLTIALDYITEAGWFLEIECISNNEDNARQTINEMRESLHLSNADVENLPYRDIVMKLM